MKYNILKSPIHGFGCFSIKNLRKGELVSKEPYFIFTKDMIDYTDSVLGDYYWKLCDNYLIINGLGSYCNHSYNNNIMPHFCMSKPYVSFYALKNIKKDEELFNNYGNEYWKIRNMKINN